MQVKTYVTEAEYERLVAAAAATDRSLASLLRLVLREYLDQAEQEPATA
jgi:hypothetical protein